MFDKTIVAVSTGLVESAIAIVRLSGDESIDIVQKMFDHDLSKAQGYTIHYGNIVDENEIVDEVLINVFKAPRSFTGENMIEINCHGGIFVTKRILNLCVKHGAILAQRGEFTQRAFLNGKMDLTQAEGIHDLITAKNDISAQKAISSIKGSVKKILDPLVDDIVQIIANIEVNIDYPEYDDVLEITHQVLLPKCYAWQTKMEQLIQATKNAIQARNGIKTVIVGKPNVGKSSLLNALLEEEKAIVTDIAGTTRDLVDGYITLGDLSLHLIDTAGIHEADDVVEKIGIERSLQALSQAQLVILVLDPTRPLDEVDEELLEKTKDKNRIIVYNKKDIASHEGIAISAKSGDIQPLIDQIHEQFKDLVQVMYSDTLNNERQLGLALQAKEKMGDVIAQLEMDVDLDLVTIDLQSCYQSLKEITSEVSKENLLDEIFSRFCLGK